MVIGSVVPTVLIESAKQIMPRCFLMTGYAMTEVCTGVAMTVPNEMLEFPKSSGRCVPGVQVKIINNAGEKCGINEDGEIHVRSPIPALGYYQDEIATKSAFDAENFFASGDIGLFDESGRIHIVGRKKEIFKNHGFAVSPAEIEDVILKNAAIQNACVVNVYDDDIMSDLPAAVVIVKDKNSITEDEVYSLVAGKNENHIRLNSNYVDKIFRLDLDQLASYKRLDGGVYFVDWAEFPMTASGKIIRSKVAETAQTLYQAKKTKADIVNL